MNPQETSSSSDTLIVKILSPLFRTKVRIVIVAFLLVFLGWTAFQYTQIKDNNSTFKMLDPKIERNAYYLNEYVQGFGKDDYILVSLPVAEDIHRLPEQLAKVQQYINHLTIEIKRTDERHGFVVWPGRQIESPQPSPFECLKTLLTKTSNRNFSMCMRRAMFPAKLPITRDPNGNYFIDLSPEERASLLQTGMSASEVNNARLPIKCDDDRCTLNPIVSTLSVNDIPYFVGNTLKSFKEVLADHGIAQVLQDKRVKDFLISNIMDRNVLGEPIRGSVQQVAIFVELRDLRSRDELRIAIMDHLQEQLANISVGASLIGVPVLNASITEQILTGHVIREPIVFILLVVALFLIFRKNLRLFMIALAIVITSVVFTLGCFGSADREFTWLTSILPIVLIVTSVSDSIHILTYYRNALQNHNTFEAARQTIQHMFVPCLFTTLTTALSLFSLYITTNISAFADFGLFSTIGVLIAFIISFVFFALFARLKSTSSSTAMFNQITIQANDNSRLTKPFDFLDKFYLWIYNYHKLILLFSLVLVTATLATLPWLSIGTNALQFYGEKSSLFQVTQHFEKHFSGSNTYAITLTEGDPPLTCHDPKIQETHGIKCATLPPIADKPEVEICMGPGTLQALLKITQSFEQMPHSKNQFASWVSYTKADGQPGYLRGTNHSILDILAPHMLTSNKIIEVGQLMAWVEMAAHMSESANHMIRSFFNVATIRTQNDTSSQLLAGCATRLLRVTQGENSEVWVSLARAIEYDLKHEVCGRENHCQAHLTGMTHIWNMMSHDLLDDMTMSFLVATFVVIGAVVLMLQSRLWLALLGIIPNILPFLLIPGLMALFSVPLDYITLMVGAVAMGLVVDDTVHFCHRLHLELGEQSSISSSPTIFSEALRRTIQQTGQAALITSLILISGFAVLLIGDFQPLIRVGRLLLIIIGVAWVADYIIFPAVLITINRWLDKTRNPVNHPNTLTP